MTRARLIRKLAFQALFQLDVRSEADAEAILSSLDDELDPSVSGKDRNEAFDLALAAFRDRRGADEAILALAPTWPAPRQPAVDRAILRLAHYEMTSGRANPKVVVNEAVELAKEFSTERSPAFVNGVLDKVLKRVAAKAVETADDESGALTPIVAPMTLPEAPAAEGRTA